MINDNHNHIEIFIIELNVFEVLTFIISINTAYLNNKIIYYDGRFFFSLNSICYKMYIIGYRV